MTAVLRVALAVFHLSMASCPAPAGTRPPALVVEDGPTKGWFDGDVHVDPDTPLGLVPLVVAHETYGHWCLYVTGGRWRDERLATARARELLAG